MSKTYRNISSESESLTDGLNSTPSAIKSSPQRLELRTLNGLDFRINDLDMMPKHWR